METLAFNRLRSRRYVRCRARGMSREVSCAAAGYHKDSATRIERRLKGEIEQEKRKLLGRLGHVPSTFGRNDARKLLRAELERLADAYGPRTKELEGQSLRGLAQQIALPSAEEHLRRIERQLSREAQTGGVTPRTLKIRDLCRQLVAEIRARDDRPTFPDPYVLPTGRPKGGAPATITATTAPEAAVGGGAPAPPALLRCRVHPSVVLSGPAAACRLCGLDPTRRWRGQGDDDDFPVSY